MLDEHLDSVWLYVHHELILTGSYNVGLHSLILTLSTGSKDTIDLSALTFTEVDGSITDYTLKAGESMLIDTGYLSMMDETVSMEIEAVKGIKNMVLGGEGIFNTRLTGPGRIWLQSMPISSVANAISPFIPSKS